MTTVNVKILEEINNSDQGILSFNDELLDTISISLSDFGTFCTEHETHTCSFGTRYYQAPEIILLGKCSYPVDIWALGCTFYELLSGELLFDPIKSSCKSRDYYHLCLINDTCGTFPYNFCLSGVLFNHSVNCFSRICFLPTTSKRLNPFDCPIKYFQ